MQTKGQIDELKQQMRNTLIHQLHADTTAIKPPITSSYKVAIGLICDYLSKIGLKYSLSVLVPETGMQGKMLTINEIREHIHIGPST